MPNCSSADMPNLRKAIQEIGKDVEEKVLASLPPDILEVYKISSYKEWIPMEKMDSLYYLVSKAVFPDAQDREVQLAKIAARKSFGGVFRIFLLIPSINYVISRSANIWKNYYDAGEGSVENVTDNSCDFVVKNFPEFLQRLRNAVCGHVTVLIEMAGGKDVKIEHVETNPKAWRWKISWS